MKCFIATFIGRPNNAQGITYLIRICVIGKDKEDATLNLYKTHEHISNLMLEEVES